MVLSKLLPSTLRYRFDWLLRPLCALPRCLLIFFQARADHGGVFVFYGHGYIPQIGEPIYGGLVKFQRMQEEFPNTPRGFNILYMVSSRIPYGGQQIAWSAKRKGARLVWNQNGVAYPAWCPQGWRQINDPLAKIHASADYIFYQSKFCKISADRFLGKTQGQWEILYNAVDTEKFTPRKEILKNDPLVLLLGGNQFAYYRVECALKVLSLLVDRGVNAKLCITGRLGWRKLESDALAEVKELIRKLKLNGRVDFCGPYSQEDAPSILQKAHILLHTTVNDACPGLLVEALACGVPVVYSATGGVPELVGAEAGIGIPGELNWDVIIPPDSAAMATATLTIAKNLTFYAGEARKRAVEKFDIRFWMSRHREVFAAVLN